MKDHSAPVHGPLSCLIANTGDGSTYCHDLSAENENKRCRQWTSIYDLGYFMLIYFNSIYLVSEYSVREIQISTIAIFPLFNASSCVSVDMIIELAHS